MSVYYNEHDPNAAAWLRELINCGLIADGVVDERSIEDVCPNEIQEFTQCHFFAGVGVWSYALRQAGWPDHRRVWTASCPCQPFSEAGSRAGFIDKRHLWPALFWLVEQLRPVVLFGEQVASKSGDTWLDLVQTDMEGLDYTIGPLVLPVAGFGAPHGRHRIYFVADSSRAEFARRSSAEARESSRFLLYVADSGASSNLADAARGRRKQSESRDWHGAFFSPDGQSRQLGDASGARSSSRECKVVSRTRRRQEGRAVAESSQASVGPLEHADGGRFAVRRTATKRRRNRTLLPSEARRLADADIDLASHGDVQRAGRVVQSSAYPTAGFWAEAEWLYCRDEKWRPIEPGSFPLAHGAAERVVRLRGYGNAICAEVAKEFIAAYLTLD
jgi:DNA (cytosine-5)-methyltransferase 1